MENREEIKAVRQNMERVIVGKRYVIDLLLTALLAEGHVLLEDMPGTGKTMMAKALAKSIDAKFGRIQFTPDLLPSDVTGLNIFHQKTGDFEFHEGPVFSNILLADEINRATPRTQSALLECMEEGQVTVDGVTRQLSAPFMVIATQNPVETAGTFPLPEAQLDRFLFKAGMGLMNTSEELLMLERYQEENPLISLEFVCHKEWIEAARAEVRQVYVHKELLSYLQSICEATRRDKEILLGVSPRGTLALLRAVKAYAYLKGRSYVVPDDIKDLAIPTLSHRLIMQGGSLSHKTGEGEILKILQTTPVPTEDFKE